MIVRVEFTSANRASKSTHRCTQATYKQGSTGGETRRDDKNQNVPKRVFPELCASSQGHSVMWCHWRWWFHVANLGSLPHFQSHQTHDVQTYHSCRLMNGDWLLEPLLLLFRSVTRSQTYKVILTSKTVTQLSQVYCWCCDFVFLIC